MTVVDWGGNFNWNGRNSRYRQHVVGKGGDMKKVIIAIIIISKLYQQAQQNPQSEPDSIEPSDMRITERTAAVTR
jgi:hypothetical protein